VSVRATYRIQFHKGFTFLDAAKIVDYLADLGISHLYASPILTARSGSRHGYDVVDYGHINPELGGEAGFRTLAAALKRRGLGIIADIVPNHMGVGKADNRWWLDVLQHGMGSRYARNFDIDWNAPGLEEKILAPFLDGPPGKALDAGDLRLVREPQGVSFAYYDHRFPLRPEHQGIDPDSLSRQEQEQLLCSQHFVLADWRDADSRINWRRFFDITDLAAIRVLEPAVFEAVHAKIFALYDEGLLDGARVDHVDGIADPRAYCIALRERLDRLRPGAVIWVEKILAEGESLADDWPVDGTTGYDFMNDVSALLHREDQGRLERQWQAISGRGDFESEELLARHEILARKFGGQRCAVARAFSPCLPSRAISEIEQAITVLIANLRCYRGYANGGKDSPGPDRFFDAALINARTSRPDLGGILQELSTLFARRDGSPDVMDALRRFWQLSAPVAAKAVEDTAFYRYGRLLSRNDVGFDPRCHRLTPTQFHQRVQMRSASTMLTTATHDHKRGEDARARLATLSKALELWCELADRFAAADDVEPADAYHLLQSLFGAWPEEEVGEEFAARIEGWCEKYLREAKLRSSWMAPNKERENALKSFARSLILSPERRDFRSALAHLRRKLGDTARANGIVQTVLRNTLPGVPDLYQGCEFQDLSLVDPDNRRPVDFRERAAALKGGDHPKLQLIRKLLTARRHNPLLWESGDYRPIDVGQNALAFSRRHRDNVITVLVQLDDPVNAQIILERRSTDLLTGREFGPGPQPAALLLQSFPAAILLSRNADGVDPTGGLGRNRRPSRASD